MISPRKLLTDWNLKARKELGQNFLSETSTAEMIVSRAGLSPEDVVLEIGAGLGALTLPIARAVRSVYAIEKDLHVADLLNTQLLTGGVTNVAIFKQDILKLDLTELARTVSRKLIVMGNLPYNISSQVLVQLIAGRSRIDRAVLMFQKELADRITAPVGIKAYGRLSVMLAYCADIATVAAIPARMFFPRPKVDSTVIEIRFKETPEFPAHSEPLLFKVIKTAFGKRRKTLKNALIGNELQLDATHAEYFLRKAGIDPVRRAETVSVAEFVSLSNCIYERDNSA